jgi:hypothetical protein
MKNKLALLAAIMLGAVSASAQEAAPAPEAQEGSALSASVSMSYDGKYVFRGVQCAEAIFSPAVNLSYGNLYGSLWFAVPAQNADDYVNEMDTTIGYNIQATDLLTVDVGITHYAYDEVIESWIDKDNSTEAYVGINADTILAPGVYIYRDFDLSTLTFEGKIGHSIEVMKDLSVALGANVGYVLPDDEDDQDYVYASAKADLVYSITEKSSASIGVRYSVCSEDYIGKHKDENNAVWLGASISTGF